MAIDGLNHYSDFVQERTIRQAFEQGPRVATILAGTGALSTLQTPFVQVGLSSTRDQQSGSPMPFFYFSDYKPPAVPILMMRRARQAVADAPNSERSYQYLSAVVQLTQTQEGIWLRNAWRLPGGTRDTLRRLQQVAALRTAADLGSADPKREYFLQRNLAQMYLDIHFRDLAVVHMALAVQTFESLQPADPKFKDDFKKQLDGQKKQLQRLEDDVERRKRKFNVESQGLKTDMEKVAYALRGPYRVTEGDKEAIDPEGLGLVLEARKILDKITPASIKEHEEFARLEITLNLDFNMGLAHEAAKLVDKQREALEQRRYEYLIYSAGVLGNYAELDKTLAHLEAKFAASMKELSNVKKLAPLILSPPPVVRGPFGMLDRFAVKPSLETPNLVELNLGLSREAWLFSATEYFTFKTLRGIMALEAGDTPLAHRLFRDVVQESHAAGIDFTDRPIAERYEEFLAKYQK